MITMSQDGDNNNSNNKLEDLHEQDMVMPGFRFHPTEEELIEFYLRRKIEGKRFNVDLIAFLDLYRYDPWELPALAAIGEKEWYFYVPRDRKYRNGDRPNRVTTSGYWKATGADRLIKNETLKPIGLKKTLVFYSGKAPRGIRTSWIMNEYRLPHHETEMLQKAEISLCRVYKRPGVEDHRPTTAISRGHLGKASKINIAHNLDTKPTSQSDVVMNSSCGQVDEAEKLMSTETSASSSTDIGSGIISHAKHHHHNNNNNNASYDPFLQVPISLPHANTSSLFSIFGCNNTNPVIPHHQNHNNNGIPFDDLQMMPSSYQQGYINQHQQQSLLGLNMVPNSSFWDQWTSSSNSVILHGSDQGSSSKGYNNINATNPFRNERSTY